MFVVISVILVYIAYLENRNVALLLIIKNMMQSQILNTSSPSTSSKKNSVKSEAAKKTWAKRKQKGLQSGVVKSHMSTVIVKGATPHELATRNNNEEVKADAANGSL